MSLYLKNNTWIRLKKLFNKISNSNRLLINSILLRVKIKSLLQLIRIFLLVY
jgi:hypothetical protein